VSLPLPPWDPRTWHWDLLAAFGFVAQALFAARFLVQWIASERKRMSHVPIQFWYLSLLGGLLMTVYGILRRDPVITLGQAPALIIYVRNLMLIYRAQRHSTQTTSPDRA
jgi:lipid-A-disaccharide synthase-like uncharacterized protein